VGVDISLWKVLIAIDSRYYRPIEVDILIGDPKKVRGKLGWKFRSDLKN
jgi:GDPmannose 4,6-dehydratase